MSHGVTPNACPGAATHNETSGLRTTVRCVWAERDHRHRPNLCADKDCSPCHAVLGEHRKFLVAAADPGRIRGHSPTSSFTPSPAGPLHITTKLDYGVHCASGAKMLRGYAIPYRIRIPLAVVAFPQVSGVRSGNIRVTWACAPGVALSCC